MLNPAPPKPSRLLSPLQAQLRTLLKRDPTSKYLSLENRALSSSDLPPVLPLISRFTQLTHLNLHGNRLQSVTKELLDALPTTLTYIDVSNNLIGGNVKGVQWGEGIKVIVVDEGLDLDSEQGHKNQIDESGYKNTTNTPNQSDGDKEITPIPLNDTLGIIPNHPSNNYRINQLRFLPRSALLQVSEDLPWEPKPYLHEFEFLSHFEGLKGECIERDANLGDSWLTANNQKTNPTQIGREMQSSSSINNLLLTNPAVFQRISSFLTALIDAVGGLVGQSTAEIVRKELETIVQGDPQSGTNHVTSNNKPQVKQKVKDNNTSTNQFLSQAKFTAQKLSQQQSNLQSTDRKYQEGSSVYGRQMTRLRTMNQDLLHQVHTLEHENHKLIDTIVRMSSSMGGSNSLNSHHTLALNTQSAKSTLKDTFRSLTQRTRNSPQKIMTLKQVKECIEEVYESKAKFDCRSAVSQSRPTTMQEHLLFFLNNKYGLKSLSQQAFQTLMHSLERYSGEDPDVFLFMRILDNSIDEQFHKVHSQLKITVVDLLKMNIKARSPYKSAPQIQQQLNNKLNGEITLEQATEIVKYLHKQQAAYSVMDKIREKREEPIATTRRRGQQPPEPVKVKYSIFIYIICAHQIEAHMKFLQPLHRPFSLRDTDEDGVLDEGEFIPLTEELVSKLNLSRGQLQEIIEAMDPFEQGAVTYNQMVRILVQYPIGDPVLQAINLKGKDSKL